MNQIPLEIWEQSPDNPRILDYVGQAKAQEVFAELKHRLESVGMLPDEYFLFDSAWENGREIPKGAVIFSTVQYGGSEGIYLDVSISWDENDKKNIKCFATGKTLSESEYHLDRMYLTASAINKALYSNEPHARYIKIGSDEKTLEGSVLNINGAERQILLDSLIELRNSNPQDVNAVEQLLRRVAGNITEYVNEVGARPLQISDYDMAVLAIQDGNIAVFNDFFNKSPDRTGDLLICAAARPGKVGLNMTSTILKEVTGISNESYLTACKKAVAAGNKEKILMLADNAEKCVADLDMKIYGEIISEALMGKQKDIARDLVKQCTPEQIQEANSYILVQAINDRDTQLAFAMAEKKINANEHSWALIHSLKYRNEEWALNRLFERGMELSHHNFSAMAACIKTESAEMGQLLIDRGADFGQYEKWTADKNPDYCVVNDTFTALKQYWETNKPEQAVEKPIQKQTLEQKLNEAKEKAKEQGDNKTKKTPKKEERE